MILQDLVMDLFVKNYDFGSNIGRMGVRVTDLVQNSTPIKLVLFENEKIE